MARHRKMVILNETYHNPILLMLNVETSSQNSPLYATIFGYASTLYAIHETNSNLVYTQQLNNT